MGVWIQISTGMPRMKMIFFLVEAWENRKTLDDHLRSVRFTVLIGAGSLLSRPPEIMIHTVSHSSELEP
jgi:quinol monooxygenase YgiN